MVNSRKTQRQKRHFRVRSKISGTSSIPRMCVFKSNSYFYAQLINDEKGDTLVSSSSLSLNLKNANNMDAAKKVADDMIQKISAKKIKTIVFDRNGYIYHGKVKLFAETLREAGIKF
ncbi:50S ribosomal protein L18 [Spiroplasma endosymbiont of Amphibalanus improvisus]|uniref:50S ribosomal protein L18 n=1 Tax=Spiroplasma endosymbiont of Amphibalanus improvisus TaxID=3066327 RepID=UPI00313F0D63